MNEHFSRLMGEATELTRSGDLRGAAEAIQRAMNGGVAAPSTSDSGGHTPAFAARGAASASSNLRPTPYGEVIDVAARVVDTADTGRTADASAKQNAASGAMSPARFEAGRFSHQGRALGYKLFIPAREAGASARMPLVVMLHGCTQDASDFAAGTQMNELAAREGFVVLYPEQTQRANAQRCWNWFKKQHQQVGRGEPAVLAALTRSVMDAHPIDPARVYVAGLSAGGAMADILGRAYPDLFAAVGVHSGLPAGAASDLPSALAAMRSGGQGSTRLQAGVDVPPVIVFHGDADGTVHPRNGSAVAAAARDAAQARSPQSHTAATEAGLSAKGQRFTRTVYPASADRTAAEHWTLHGAGHAWSGGSTDGSYTDPRGVDASAEMLRFFLAHPRQAPGG